MIATESHRVSNWKQAVEEWNRRSLEHGGYRSGFDPLMACRECSAVGCILTTKDGTTTARCEQGHEWTL